MLPTYRSDRETAVQAHHKPRKFLHFARVARLEQRGTSAAAAGALRLLLSTVVVGVVGILGVGVVATSGCIDEGSVSLQFNLPERDDLSPTENTLGSVTLIRSRPDESPRSETRKIEDQNAPVNLGRLQIGDEISLSIELRTPSQRLVGYGRSAATIDLESNTNAVVPMNVRKPFVYLTGSTALSAFDSTRDTSVSTASYQSAIALNNTPQVVVATHNGADIVVVSTVGNGAELSLISTSNHEATASKPIALVAAPSDIAVSPDDRWVVVGHAGDSGGVSIVDLAAARLGEGEPTFVALGSVGTVSIGDDSRSQNVVALLNRATGSSCPTGPNSSIVAVSLEDPTKIGPIVEYEAPIHDIAVARDGTTVIAADNCNNRLQKLSLVDDVQPTAISMVQNPTAVAIMGNRAWAVGTLPASPTAPTGLILVSVDIDGGAESRVELPPFRANALAKAFDGNGQRAVQELDADDLWGTELAVLPGAEQVALLVSGSYHGMESGSFLGQPIIPEMTIVTNEYLLINASTTAIAQRVRPHCQLDVIFGGLPPVLVEWTCAQTPGQDVTANDFVPQQLAVLYGSR